jgi:hypothetical protein
LARSARACGARAAAPLYRVLEYTYYNWILLRGTLAGGHLRPLFQRRAAALVLDGKPQSHSSFVLSFRLFTHVSLLRFYRKWGLTLGLVCMVW